ncbi:MAG: hypothetical protein PVI00_14285 [Desulfobacterales bacterium]|jgi:hypothetical protein
MLAVRSMLGGLLAIAVGVGLKALKSGDGGTTAALVLLFVGALLWSIAALTFAAIREDAAATEGGRNALKEAAAGLNLLAQNIIRLCRKFK